MENIENQNPANGGEGGAQSAQNAGQPVNQPANHPTASNPPATPSAEDIERIVESAMQKKGKSVVRSLADQYGLTESEITAALEQRRADKAKELPDDAKRQIEEANARANNALIAADVRAVGAEMGLIDPQTALMLLDKEKIKVDGDAVTGTKEALETLKAQKPYLFGQSGAWGQKQNANAPKGVSRAAQIAKDYREAKYGKAKEN